MRNFAFDAILFLRNPFSLLINGRLSLVSKLCTEELRSLCIASGHSISTGVNDLERGFGEHLADLAIYRTIV
jgi:hypothetical protein